MGLIELAVSIFLFSVSVVIIIVANMLYLDFYKKKIELKYNNPIQNLPNFALPKVQIDFWMHKYYDLVKYNNQSLIEKNEVILLQSGKIKALISEINNLKEDPYHIETQTKQFKKKDRIK